MNLCSKTYFVQLMRFMFGSWLLYVGAVKWIAGPSGFINYLGTQFEPTWVPALLITSLGWLILAGEVVCGAWLLAGKAQRLAWTVTAFLMWGLMFGQTLLKNHTTVPNNWQYVVLAAVCAALSSSSAAAHKQD